jgi:hypothetical protein
MPTSTVRIRMQINKIQPKYRLARKKEPFGMRWFTHTRTKAEIAGMKPSLAGERMGTARSKALSFNVVIMILWRVVAALIHLLHTRITWHHLVMIYVHSISQGNDVLTDFFPSHDRRARHLFVPIHSNNNVFLFFPSISSSSETTPCNTFILRREAACKLSDISLHLQSGALFLQAIPEAVQKSCTPHYCTYTSFSRIPECVQKHYHPQSKKNEHFMF